jgi:hypothetical protein
MGYIALGVLLRSLLRRARAWNERVSRINSRGLNHDDFYDIFMFGPHG